MRSLVAILLFALTCEGLAQTDLPPAPSSVATNVGQLIGIPQDWNDAASVILSGLVDAVPYIPNKIVDVEAGGLYNPSAKKGTLGSFVDITLPVSNQAGIGVGTAYLNRGWLCATVNLKVGTTVTVPTLGAVYVSMASGPEYDLQAGKLGAYNFSEAIKKWDLNKTLVLTAGIAIGNISTIPGPCLGFGASLTWHY